MVGLVELSWAVQVDLKIRGLPKSITGYFQQVISRSPPDWHHPIGAPDVKSYHMMYHMAQDSQDSLIDMLGKNITFGQISCAKCHIIRGTSSGHERSYVNPIDSMVIVAVISGWLLGISGANQLAPEEYNQG